MKINNYETDDDKEKIKDINNPDTEIPFIGDFLP
jgi:hypothetical protein